MRPVWHLRCQDCDRLMIRPRMGRPPVRCEACNADHRREYIKQAVRRHRAKAAK